MVTFNGIEFDALKLTFESGLFFKTGWLSNDDTANELKKLQNVVVGKLLHLL